MRKLRVSAISFLNTAPLMWDFEHGAVPAASTDRPLPGPLEGQLEVEYTVPSLCAEALRSGSADIGIIPVAAYATIPNLAIIPDVAIATKGPVRSILLVSKIPLAEVRSLAADTSSRTSVALAKVLFQQWFGHMPDFFAAAPHLDSMLSRCDAALIIGDPAFTVDRRRCLTRDLAEEWMRLTGKPFVFAFWAVRLGALSGAAPDLNLISVFAKSRDHGVAADSLPEIARNWAKHVSLGEAEICDYLAHNIYYWLDAETVSGLELFFRYAADCGALPGAPPLRFLGTMSAAMSILAASESP